MDGTWINDVPSFDLSLGEAINGPNGYFGGDLDALSDCFCGDSGVRLPLTVWLSHYNEVRNALGGRAWCRFHAEAFQEYTAYGEEILTDNDFLGDGSPLGILQWTAKYQAALADEPFEYDEFGSYFDAILKVFAENDAAFSPEDAE